MSKTQQQAQTLCDAEYMGDEAFEALYRILDPFGYLAALRRLGRHEEADRLLACLDWERTRP